MQKYQTVKEVDQKQKYDLWVPLAELSITKSTLGNIRIATYNKNHKSLALIWLLSWETVNTSRSWN